MKFLASSLLGDVKNFLIPPRICSSLQSAGRIGPSSPRKQNEILMKMESGQNNQ